MYLACTYALGRVLRKKLLSPNSLVLIDGGNQGITICSIFYTSFHILLKAKNIQSNDFTRKALIYGSEMWRRPSTLPTTTHASSEHQFSTDGKSAIHSFESHRLDCCSFKTNLLQKKTFSVKTVNTGLD